MKAALGLKHVLYIPTTSYKYTILLFNRINIELKCWWLRSGQKMLPHTAGTVWCFKNQQWYRSPNHHCNNQDTYQCNMPKLSVMPLSRTNAHMLTHFSIHFAKILLTKKNASHVPDDRDTILPILPLSFHVLFVFIDRTSFTKDKRQNGR